MIKSIFVFSALLSLIIALAACGSVATSVGSPQTGQTPSPMSTEKIFALTKFGMLTGEAETETEVSPKNSATVASIISTKYAGGTEMAETITAMPTLTLTPAIPSGSPYCRQIDLNTSINSGPSMGGTFSIDAGFTNISNAPCYLQTWSQVILLDGQGKPLDVDYSYFDTSGVNATVAATEQARDSATAKIGLWPGWTAWISLIWGNWCKGPIQGKVVFRLTLINDLGTINIPTDIQAGGICNAPNYRSSIGISNLSVSSP